jgi:hypothetical protein
MGEGEGEERGEEREGEMETWIQIRWNQVWMRAAIVILGILKWRRNESKIGMDFFK